MMHNVMANKKFILGGIALSLGYWIIESFIHISFFEKGSLLTAFFPLNGSNEFWMRTIIIFLIIVFSIHVQKTFNKLLLYAENERKARHELQCSLNEIKTLKGLIPICCSCKKIRDDNGFWQQVEKYIKDHSEAEFTHSYCPTCLEKFLNE